MGKSNKLTVKKIESYLRNGWRNSHGKITWDHSKNDGNGLDVQFRGDSVSFLHQWTIDGVRHFRGLGSWPTVSLEDARLKRDEDKKLLAEGIDPKEAHKKKRETLANALSVEQACERYIKAQKAKWRTEDQIKQLKQRQRDYVSPIIGHLPIADIKGAEVRQVLSPIWTRINPTASRIRQFMEGVVNWAIHEGVRSDESNPWEEKRLEFAFPFGIHRVVSHPALSFTEAPAFLAELRKQEGVKAKTLEFVMFTIPRIGDIVGGGKDHSVPMLWSHVSMSERVWIIPDTKKNRPHEVPLSKPAMRVLAEMQHLKDPTSDFVFPGAKRGTVISDATLRYLIADMGYAGTITTHGMRATFRTWAREATNADKDVVKACMAHAKEEMDEVYHRGSFFDKRRRLMNAWGDFLEGKAVSRGGELIALRA